MSIDQILGRLGDVRRHIYAGRVLQHSVFTASSAPISSGHFCNSHPPIRTTQFPLQTVARSLEISLYFRLLAHLGSRHDSMRHADAERSRGLTA